MAIHGSEVLIAYERLEDHALLGLLFTQGDRLPRAFAGEVVRRGRRLVPGLAGVVGDSRNWERLDAGWCAPIHATFLLGAIGGEEAIAPLIEAMRRAVDADNGWVNEDIPSIFGALGPAALEPLRRVASDREANWYLRERALRAMAALASRHPGSAGEIFPFVAGIARDESDDPETRGWAADILLDFRLREYEPLILELAQPSLGAWLYEREDVQKVLLRPKPDLREYRHDWMAFYSAKSIAARQERWRQGRLSEEQAWEDLALIRAEEEAQENAHREVEKALRELGPLAALALKVREAAQAGGRKRDKAALERHYALAMDLREGMRRRDTEGSGDSGTLELLDIASEDCDLWEWILDLPSELAEQGLIQEAVSLTRAWAGFEEAENLLDDLPLLLAKAGRGGEAREQILENLEHPPRERWARIKAGEAYHALGDLAAAEEQHRRVLELAERGQERREALERLVKLLRESGRASDAEAVEAQEIRHERQSAWIPEPYVRQGPKVGRNDPCPCGSGKKYKKCCLGRKTPSLVS